MAKKQCPKCNNSKVQKYGYVESQPQIRLGQNNGKDKDIIAVIVKEHLPSNVVQNIKGIYWIL